MINHCVGVSFDARACHVSNMLNSQTKRKGKVCENSSCENRSVIHQGRMTPDQIRAELDARNMSIRDLADATGINENYLTKSLGKAGRRIQVAEMDAIRAVLMDDRGGPQIPTVPLLGKVPAGAFKAAEQSGARRIAAPDPDLPVNAYALRVEGDSMDLLVPSGTIIIIDPDDKNLWPGRRYVVQNGEGEATFKEFQADPARLVPLSSNPEHKEIPLGAEPVVIAGRVISYSLRDADLPRRVS